MERDCNNCIWSSRDGNCSSWECEFVRKREAYEAWKKARWIPVTERLPETSDMMLVSCRTTKGVNSVNRAYFDGQFWHGSGSMSGVKAWQPLPEPYEEAK